MGVEDPLPGGEVPAGVAIAKQALVESEPPTGSEKQDDDGKEAAFQQLFEAADLR